MSNEYGEKQVLAHLNFTNETNGLLIDGLFAYQWDLQCGKLHVYVEDIYMWFTLLFARCTIMWVYQ